VKGTVKKPELKPKKRRTVQKRKRRRAKLTRRDGIIVALLTGLFILAAGLAGMGIFVFRSPPEGETVAASGREPPLVPVPSGKPENAPAFPEPVEVPEPAVVYTKPPETPAVSPEPAEPPQVKAVPPEPGPPAPAAPAGSSPVLPARKTEEPKPVTKPEPPKASGAESPETASPPESKPVPETVSVSPPAPARGRIEMPPEPRPKGTLVFVIDDAGNNLRELEPFLRFPGPLTIAVLPGLPNSAEAARRIRAAGKEVFLHQPMEALGGQNPGPGAVYTGMSREEVRAVVERNLAELGPVAGINNHQGSKVTGSVEIMETLLSVCREHGIFFLDSRTTADTVVPAVAKRMGITIGERDVFIDNIPERASMIRYVEDGLQRAEQKGDAVMIGHTWSSELAAVLESLYPDLTARGYSLSTISRLLTGRR
jgi:polysaccharide deacetylase 2 family uncharacterized protein YibQ